MRIFLLFCCLITAGLVACSDKDKVPAGVLPPAKMDSVMWDMLRAGEFINGYVVAVDTGAARGSRSLAVYEEVLKIHKINRQQFDESLAWYQAHPDQMKQLLDTLSKRPYTGDSVNVERRRSVTEDSLLPGLKINDSLLKQKRAERRGTVVPQKLSE